MSKYYYFNSDNVKAFPCSYRGYNGTGTPKSFNAESKLQTEFNLTRGTNSSWPEYESYLITKQLVNTTFKLVIAGYYFEIKGLAEAISSFNGTDKSLYFGIKLRDLSLLGNDVITNSDKTTILTRFGTITEDGGTKTDQGGDYLDEQMGTGTSKTYEFRGLVLTDEAISNDDAGTIFTLRLTDSTGAIFSKSFLPEITHGAGKNSLVIGTALAAKNDNELVIGKYNVDINNGVFVIGNGNSVEGPATPDTKNILEVTTSGNTYAWSATPAAEDENAAVVINGRLATNVDPIILSKTTTRSGTTGTDSIKQSVLFRDKNYNDVSWVSSTIGKSGIDNSTILGIADKAGYTSELFYTKTANATGTGCKLYSSSVADLGTSTNRFGKLYLSDAIDMTDATDTTGSNSSKFSVTSAGALTCADNFTTNGDLTVKNGTTSKFSVDNSTGDTSIAGTLEVTGNTTLSGTLMVTDATTLGSDSNTGAILTVNGTSTFNGDITAPEKTITAATFSGTATKADKLTTAAKGNASLPVYFSGGVPVECSTPLSVDIKGTADSADNIKTSPTSSGNKYLITVSNANDGYQSAYFNSGVYINDTDMYASSYTATSDRRLKENIKDTEINAIDLINRIKIKEFNFISDETKSNTIGCIAQELREVLPDNLKSIVRGEETEDSYLGIDNDKLIYILIKAVQELTNKE